MISFRRRSAFLCVAVLSIYACTLSAEPGTIFADASGTGPAADGALRHEPVRSSNTAVDASPSTTLSGVLEAIVVDDFAQDTSEMQYYLRGDDGTGRQIHFPAAPRLRPGERLTVTGQTVGEAFYAYGYEEPLTSVSMPAGSIDGDLHVIGEQRTLVLLLNFLDDLSEPNTVAEVEDMVFSDSNPLSINSRLRELSYGKTWLAGDVLDWLTLPISAGDCAAYLTPVSSAFQNTVDFVDHLVDFSLYTRIIALKPFPGCPVGGLSSFGDFPITTDEGQFQVSLANGSLDPIIDMPNGTMHELGHNFRLIHPDGLECGDAAVGDHADGCDMINRGNRFDIMARNRGHNNASAKQRVGWFDPQNIAELGTGTHEITLHPLELPSDQVQAVRIPAAYNLSGFAAGVSAFYVIEYRQAIGLDSSFTELDDPEVGVLIYLEEKDYFDGAALLDMSPHVTTEALSQRDDSDQDPYLRLGQTFTDTKHGISITFSGLAAGAAVLTIDVPRLCDDGTCDPGEDSCSCPADCGPPNPADCTRNGIPDECEPDCNNNGVADSCDIAADAGADCPGSTGNGIPDECDPQVDCNGNGVIDSCDIAGDARGDLNANGIPDDCEPHEMVHVNMGNCPGPGSGTVQDPFCNIQDAIDAQDLGAGENDVVEIIVADGIYTGERNKNLDFAGRLITVRSANGPDNCIIDMQGEGRGFNFHSGESAGARVEGLTIRNGSFGTRIESVGGGIYCHESSPTIVDCTITGNTVEGIGGGIVAESRSNPAIINCRITDNVVSNTWGSLFGGGIACLGSSPSISGCVISNNAATGTFSAGSGGGIYLWGHSNPTITGCTISSNTVFGAGGGIYCRQNSNPTIRDCLITNNSATAPAGIGGGIFVFKARPTLDSCTITGNTAPLGAGIGIQEGDMIQESEVRIVIRNCLIASNDAGVCGGGIGVFQASTATIKNCTITGNTSDFGGGGICLSENPGRVIDMIVTNSILWGNIAQGNTNELAQIFTDASALTINYSDIQGLTGALGGVANIGDDPRFVSGTDLRLTECSPCIDAGNNSAVTWSTDLDGNARIVNGIVDMGAYEAGALGDCPCPTCLSDADCNDGDACTVDVCDESCQCVRTPTFNVDDECCDPANGQVVLIDDDDGCTIDMCNPATGQVSHTDRPDCILFDADAFPKNRYVSFETGVVPVELAFQVRMTASTHFPESIGDLGWVGAPDSKGTALVVPDPVFLSSWPTVVRTGDCEIVPAATYEIRSTGDGVNFGPPIVVDTTAAPTPKFWGDIVGDFNGIAWTPPNGVLNFVDVQAAIKTFQNGESTAPLIWADIVPETPNRVVNFNEVLWLVLAFTGEPYPFSAPADCP